MDNSKNKKKEKKERKAEKDKIEKEREEKVESNTIFSSIHYVIVVIFFFVILVNILSLTLTTYNMDVSTTNENAVTAKNLMIAANVITYLGEILIVLFVIITYSYQSYQSKELKSYYDELFNVAGSENLYIATRVVAFSMLMIISVIVSSLCLEAANYISMSDDPSEYTDQYNICNEIGKLFFVHFILFTSIQGVAYIYQLFYNTGAIKKSPENLFTGRN